MNNPQVQRALHANSTGLPYSWNMYCEGGTDYKHLEMYANDVIPTVSALLKRHIRVMLYSGDQDLMVAVTQTRKIASKIARDLKLNTLHNNRPWYNGKQIGGWSQTYGRLKKGKTVIQLTFATVKGGANFVPYSSPSEALILFKAFLKGSPPPTRPS
ncbi:unnamed protein product [Cuscuta europaea]|uniref:Uncharacterized protein n=1 Tax=Cuscuta europaea TaxID=41803 RepID=A0A9P0ZAU8_CUSEU|nr:unnamed protein product [Cuscuta europaea]